MKDFRSVRGVASDVVVELIAARIIANDAATVHRVCVALGLDRTHLEEATLRRREGEGWGVVPQTAVVRFSEPPEPVGPEMPPEREPERDTPPTPAAKPPTKKTPPRTPPRPEQFDESGDRLLRCTGPCGDWLPTNRFLPRTDRPGHFTSRCFDCRRIYQAEHRVSTRTLEALDKIGVKFDVDANSNLVGLLCAKCDQPFKPGETAETETGLTHTTCPTKPKRKRGK